MLEIILKKKLNNSGVSSRDLMIVSPICFHKTTTSFADDLELYSLLQHYFMEIIYIGGFCLSNYTFDSYEPKIMYTFS